MVRPVQPHVDGLGRGAQDTRQVRPAHHAGGRTVRFEQAVDRLVIPRRMPQLDGDGNPARHGLERTGQALVVALEVRWQLEQEEAGGVAESVEPVADPTTPFVGVAQLAGVSQTPGRLDGHEEPGRYPLAPTLEHGSTRPPVEAAVELDGVELGHVGLKPLRVGAGRIQHVLPMVVAPSRRPDPHLAGCHASHPFLFRRTSRGGSSLNAVPMSENRAEVGGCGQNPPTLGRFSDIVACRDEGLSVTASARP